MHQSTQMQFFDSKMIIVNKLVGHIHIYVISICEFDHFTMIIYLQVKKLHLWILKWPFLW